MAGGAGSKNKGGRGERELCRLLGERLGGSFIRSPNSGAFIGGSNARRKAHLSEGQVRTAKGDIVAPDDLPRLIIEVKFYKEFRFHQLLRGNDPLLDDWIKQSLDVIDPSDEWFVCWKINMLGWFVCLPEEKAEGYAFDSYAHYIGKQGAFRVTDLDTFFTANCDEVRRRSAG
jgi:hypothetical protein